MLALLGEHGSAIEADLLRSGLSLRMLVTGELSLRELLSLLRHPTRDSVYARSVLGVEDWTWDLHAHLLAALVDGQNGGNWQRGGGRGTKPTPIRRPGQGGPRKSGNTTGMTPAQVQAALQKMSGRKLAVPGA